jgi:DNA-binding Lrp family transcriptional regulator
MAAGIKAFVLVEAEQARLKDLMEELDQMELADSKITAVHACTGPYDLIVEVESPDLESLAT